MTALLYASADNYPDVISVLLAAGAHPNHVDGTGTSALWHSAFKNRLETTQLLLKGGADPNLPGEYGRSPLLVASKQGWLPLAEAIVSNGTGVKVNQPDQDGRTPLYWAAW